MDKNILKIMEQNLNSEFIDMILSNPPASAQTVKFKIRPVKIKDNIMYQVTEYRNKQVFHTNFSKEDLLNKLPEWLEAHMKQILLRTRTRQITVLISKKGKATIKVKEMNNELKEPALNHNREKSYILKEGIPVAFLEDLGVMTKEGNIIKAKYDKFKQINRFLEFIEDILPALDKTKELTIIDFGCGKSYLTFAMYYYLKELKGYPIQVIGLDLKKEVINNCNKLAISYGYDKLTFLEGDIVTYEGVKKVDMVVSLHACDTATDYALYKAVLWEADVILSVPCCQHELNAQIGNKVLNPILGYGLIKERIAALTTDALRANLLELAGYRTQILEFIDMEHTPKNILIRGVKNHKKTSSLTKDNTFVNSQTLESNQWKDFDNCKEFLGVNPTLYKLLSDNNLIHVVRK